MTSYSIVWKVKNFLGGCSMRGKVKIGGGRGKSGFFTSLKKYNLYYWSSRAGGRFFFLKTLA